MSHEAFQDSGTPLKTSAQVTTVSDADILPAYVIEWSTSHRRLQFLKTVDSLEAELDPLNHERLSTSFKRLFIVHGLPAQYVRALQSRLAIDPLFVRAHSRRQRYSPLHRRPGDRWVSFEYPELCMEIASSEAPGADVGGFRLPQYQLSDNGPDIVLFCRASLWLNGENDGVLFLDEPPWAGPSARVRKAYPASFAEESTVDNGQSKDVNGHSASLEVVLQHALRDPDQIKDGLTALLSELVYNHWLVFFESPLINPENNPAHILSLAWRIQLSLEQNLNVTRYLARHITPLPITPPEWDGLLDRNSRRVSLATVAAGGPKAIAKEFRSLQEAGKDEKSLAPGEKDDHSRSLDRISYMGGIVLPFSLVSAILSMGEPFNPGGPLFWVFWLISIPVTLVTLIIIYADSIRKATVWIEVAAESGEAEATGETQETGESGRNHSTPKLTVQENSEIYEPLSDQPPRGNVVEEGIEEFPMIIMERPPNGERPRAWRKQQLGWSGAMKSMVGYGGKNWESLPVVGVPVPEHTHTFIKTTK